MSGLAQYSVVRCSTNVVSTCDNERTYLTRVLSLCPLLFRSLGVLARLGQMLARYTGPQSGLLSRSRMA